MSEVPGIDDAWLLIENGIIQDYGTMNRFSYPEGSRNIPVIDASGKIVFPAFCDSHTHLVYAGSREAEFTDKLRGLSYEEIARRGGGILNSARRLRETSEDELFRQSFPRVNEVMKQGTCTLEIKSGYGLRTEDELKMLRVIRRIRDASPIQVKSTFLGAHAVPPEYAGNREGYVDLILNEMIPAIAAEDLADYIDVFCDRGFFTVEETERILMAGMKHGMRAKIHANELDNSGGVQVGVKYDAVSVDHLERIGEREIAALQGSQTIATVLPGASFFLGLPEAPVRPMLDAGLPVAIASDFNPGSSPSGNMKLMLSLACIKLKLLPAEALCAATHNGACALELGAVTGSVTRGKQANLIVSRTISSFDYFPYAYGSDLIDAVIINGEIVSRSGV
jgi:imidazolonepropionase